LAKRAAGRARSSAAFSTASLKRRLASSGVAPRTARFNVVEWQVETARSNESLFAAPLLDKVKALGFQPRTVAMDKGYDNNRIYDECRDRSIAPIIPLRKGRNAPLTTIHHGTKEWKSLYRRRSAVEREFGRLKHQFGLVLRTRGLAKARLHADLTMLARLSQALNRVRKVPLAP
jgi:transposase